MKHNDYLQRLVFEELDARCVYVSLERVVAEVLAKDDYPLPVAELLGQGLLVAAALSSGIKFDGRVSLQLQSGGALKLLVADCTHEGGLRAIAKCEEGASLPASPEALWTELSGDGVLTLTLEPADGGQRWQGIVPLEGPSLARAIEAYFERSEQLVTRLALAFDGGVGKALMIQQMPPSGNDTVDEDGWNRLEHLVATVGSQELLQTTGEEMLNRLFHEDPRRLFPARPLQFFCPCSRDRVLDLLGSLGAAELNALFAIQDVVEVRCQFCNHAYEFEQDDLGELIDPSQPGGSQTLH